MTVIPGEKLTQKNDRKRLIRGYIALAIGTLALSLSPILVKAVEAPTVVTSFYRMFFAAVFYSFFIPFQKEPASEGKRSPLFPFILLPLLAGMISGIDHGLWSIALVKTSVSNCTVLNSMAPVWIAVFSLIFLHEKFNGRFWIGLALAMTGMVFMSGKGVSFFREGFNEGDRIAFFSSIFYCGYFMFTQLGRGHFSTLKQLWLSNIACSATLLIFCRVLGYSMTGYPRSVWVGFILTALMCQIIGYFSLTYALGILPASIVGPTDELHSVFSSLIAIPVFHETLSLHQIIGCAGIVIGVTLINQGKISQIANDAEAPALSES